MPPPNQQSIIYNPSYRIHPDRKKKKYVHPKGLKQKKNPAKNRTKTINTSQTKQTDIPIRILLTFFIRLSHPWYRVHIYCNFFAGMLFPFFV